MNLLKISKFAISSVLCSCLLSACEQPPSTALSWLDLQPEEVTTLSIWADMRASFQLYGSQQARPEVEREIAALQTRKEDFYQILAASTPYISYVFEETQKRGLPAELALLPLVESEGNPNAHSKIGASGLWQFMPRTASELGIKTNSAYDGRKDVIATTKAALVFLTDLHRTFAHDWLLAMAAYNSGPGKLQKVIKHQKKRYAKTNFWDLPLPLETKKYIPRVLAIAAIMSDPARYGFKLPVPDMRTRLAIVEVHSAYELREIVRHSGASMETLQRLNPAYRKLATAQDAPNTFLVPVDREKMALVSHLAIVDNAKRNSVLNHPVIKRRLRLCYSLSKAMAAGRS